MDIQLAEAAKEVARRGLADQALVDHASMHYSGTDIALFISVANCFTALAPVSFDVINEEWISSFISKNQVPFAAQKYLGYLLVTEKGISPIAFFSEIADGNVFWRYRHLFSSSFAFALKSRIDELLLCLSTCFVHTKSDYGQGSFFGDLNKYFSSHFEQNSELLDYFMCNPEHKAVAFSPQLIANLFEKEQQTANDYLDAMLASDSLVLVSVACFTCGQLYLNYPEKLLNRCDALVQKLSTDIDVSCVVNILQYLVYVVTEDEISPYDRNELYSTIEYYLNNNQKAAQAVIEAINWREKYDDRIIKIIELIFSQASIENQSVHTHEYDHLLSTLLNQARFELVYTLLKAYYFHNKESMSSATLSEIFGMTYQVLNSESYDAPLMDKVYDGLLKRDNDEIHFALQFADHDKKTRMLSQPLPNWLDDEKCYQLLRVFTIFCFNAEMVCSLAIKLLEGCTMLRDKYVLFCLDEVCENYWGVSKTAANEYCDPNELQQQLIRQINEHVDMMQDKHSRLVAIKDFQPSTQRAYRYQVYQHNQMQELMKDAEKKSVFFNLVSRQTTKYGKRHSFIHSDEEGKMYYEERPFAHFDNSFALPGKYMKDPLYHFCLKQEILGGDDQDETNS